MMVLRPWLARSTGKNIGVLALGVCGCGGKVVCLLSRTPHKYMQHHDILHFVCMQYSVVSEERDTMQFDDLLEQLPLLGHL